MAKKMMKAKAAKMKATGRAQKSVKKAKSALKAKSKKAVAPKMKAKSKKPAPKKAVAKKTATKKSAAAKISNRRKFKRFPTPSLWVTELSGDYEFTANASDISEGGIFLKARIKTTSDVSKLTLHLGNQGALEVMAKPIHDRIAGDSYGAGYEFTDMSSMQMKTLRGFLRNLD